MITLHYCRFCGEEVADPCEFPDERLDECPRAPVDGEDE